MTRRERLEAAEYIKNGLVSIGFEYNPCLSPPFSRDGKDDKGDFNTSVSWHHPEQSVTANFKDFAVTAVQTAGKGRGGVVQSKQSYTAKDLTGFRRIVDAMICAAKMAKYAATPEQIAAAVDNTHSEEYEQGVEDGCVDENSEDPVEQ